MPILGNIFYDIFNKNLQIRPILSKSLDFCMHDSCTIRFLDNTVRCHCMLVQCVCIPLSIAGSYVILGLHRQFQRCERSARHAFLPDTDWRRHDDSISGALQICAVQRVRPNRTEVRLVAECMERMLRRQRRHQASERKLFRVSRSESLDVSISVTSQTVCNVVWTL